MLLLLNFGVVPVLKRSRHSVSKNFALSLADFLPVGAVLSITPFQCLVLLLRPTTRMYLSRIRCPQILKRIRMIFTEKFIECGCRPVSKASISLGLDAAKVEAVLINCLNERRILVSRPNKSTSILSFHLRQCGLHLFSQILRRFCGFFRPLPPRTHKPHPTHNHPLTPKSAPPTTLCNLPLVFHLAVEADIVL